MNRPAIQHQRGIGLVTAIFLIVGLVAMIAAAVQVVGAQAQTSGLDVQGARAYQAAMAGAEWGVFRARQAAPNQSCPGTAVNVALPDSFTATVTCTKMAVNIGSTTVNRYRVVSTACSPAGATGCPNLTNNPDYVQRVVDVRFGD